MQQQQQLIITTTTAPATTTSIMITEMMIKALVGCRYFEQTNQNRFYEIAEVTAITVTTAE